MKLTRILLLLPLAAFASCSSHPTAQPQGVEFEPGLMRLSGDIGFASNGTGLLDGSAAQFGGAFGYFATENLEAGLSGDFDSINITGSDDNLEYAGLNIFGRYYTSTYGSTRPYAELSVGLGTASIGPGEENVTAIIGSIGVMHFIATDWAIELELQKSEYLLPDVSGGDTGAWGGSVGLAWFF
ncbi:MAG: hypothetical protein O3A95_04125 [Planctomycetota bacterium]|nr:hypothetical protein [Planctomycetota bacterium]MDA1113470.1 hypothetical protein [Planctomycetota bacterium]